MALDRQCRSVGIAALSIGVAVAAASIFLALTPATVKLADALTIDARQDFAAVLAKLTAHGWPQVRPRPDKIVSFIEQDPRPF